ncbi:hypothetical protein CRUP_030700 [Coryphaenoides rupestris]|nr:hypothetical protein CRUP_030700 [Coryphaenoides rupestris]
MSHSSGNESDRNGILRQLTFIKESKTMLKRESTTHSTPPSHGSSRRGSPAVAAVFLCSSRCQELKVAVQGPRKVTGKGPVPRTNQPEPSRLKQNPAATRAGSGERDTSARRPPRRTSSESPCRAAQRSGPARGPRQQQDKDTFKRHASSPSINILSRVTSRSSIRSSSSDSSGRAKSEDDTKKRGQRSGSRLNDRVTWRRIKDEDVPQILKTTLPATALPLAPSPEEEEKPKTPAMPGKLPTIILASRKTSDAIVQTEDFSSKTNSSTSPKAETAAMVSEDASRLSLLRKASNGPGSVPNDGDSEGSQRSHNTVSTGTTDSYVSGGVLFRQGSPSKSARVTPFNYTPSPMTCSSQDRPTTPSGQKTGEMREA